jgi:integrase
MATRQPLTSELQSNQTLASICDGRVRLERLPSSGIISARAWIQGKDIRKSTGERTLAAATRVATEWWQDLSVRARRGEHLHSPTFARCATQFLEKRERDASAGLISAGQYRNLRQKAALLAPLIGSVKVADITEETLERLRTTRERVQNKRGDPLTNETLKKDFVFIHSVLTYARDTLKVLTSVPKTPSFTGTKALVRRGRPFLTESEYRTLQQLARTQAYEPDLNPRVRRQRLELFWFILICVGGALRVGEAESVRWKDCDLVRLNNGTEKGEPSVRMMVLGKHSTGGQREEAYVLFGGAPHAG